MPKQRHCPSIGSIFNPSNVFMTKMLNQRALRDTYFYRKFFRIMRLTIAFLLLACIHVAATGHSQDKVTLNLKAVELRKAIIAIERKTDYRFLFNEQLLDNKPKIDVTVVETPVTEVLNQIFQNTGITYRILENKLVVLRETSEAASLANLRDVRVTGRVTSAETGDALHGVSVAVKGSRSGTISDASGNYALTVPDNATLVFSYVGYETKEVAIAGQSVINVTLSQSVKVQEQVVVIGYGTASKRDLTGSIVKVSGKEVADKPNTNPLASLQGKVSGLSVVNTGELGKEPDIRIRGTVSRTQTKPLYVVDGIFNDNIDYLSPADIESIEILKDPSSLAIFGVRGANGVIAITTKKGKSGLTVNFSASVGVKKMVDKIALVDAAGFKTLYAEQNPGFDFSLYTANTDWQDKISQNGIFNRDNINVSSNTDRNRFYMGLGYQYEEGIIKHEKLQKFNVVVSDELKISKTFKVGFNINGYRGINPQLQTFANALAATPIIEPYNSAQGLYNQLPIGTAQIANPLRVVEETNGDVISNTYRAVGNVFLEASFLRNFTFRTTYYGDLGFTDSRSYTPLVNTWNIASNSIQHENTKTGVGQIKSDTKKFQQDYLLTYANRFGDHGLTVLGGFSTIYNSFSQVNVKGSQFTTGLALPIPDDKRFWYVDNRVFVDPTSIIVVNPDKDAFGNFFPYQWEQSTVSFLARVLYNYKQKYLLNVSFRRDGSSDISTDNQYQNFVAAGAAWEMSKEDFMQSQKIFNFLKIKASVGVLGNQYTSIHYPFYPILAAPTSAVFGPNGGVPIPGYTPSFIPDPNLKWETISSYEAGVEFAVLDNHLTGDINYYNKLTKNLLTNYPAAAGQKPGITNAGEISNNGLELALSWNHSISKDLKYTISGNLTTLKNEVKKLYLDAPIYDGPSRTKVGDPIGSFFGYVVDGVYQDAADIANSPTNTLGTPSPGDLKYKDLNGDHKITDSDRAVIGNPTPSVLYGFSAGLSYKGFDFSMDFQGVSGNEIFRNWGNGAGYATLNYREARLNRWHGKGTSNSEPRVYDVGLPASTYMIENGSYLRIRNVQLGYNFSSSALGKAHIKSLRIFISGQNIKTFKNNSGYTAEFGGSATQFGVDNGSYPVPAVYSFGINANF
jgi:TonB-linked SusC/RagA family outer membrane protein